MQLIIFLLLAFFCAIAFLQHTKKEQVKSGSMDKVIGKLLAGYKTLREHTDEIGTNAFAFGYAKERHKDGLADDKGALAVVCAVGYLIAGFMLMPWVAIVVQTVLLIGAIMFLSSR